MNEILDIQCPKCGELFMGYPNYIKHLKDKKKLILVIKIV